MESEEVRKLVAELQSASSRNFMRDFSANEAVKSSEQSNQSRTAGNRWFLSQVHNSRVHEEAWKLYCKSIAQAPMDSQELALAYANRSALLLHLEKYEECIQDVERALKIPELGSNYSSLIVKLYCRKAESFSALGLQLQGKETLEEARLCLSNIPDDDKAKDSLAAMVNNAQVSVDKDRVSRSNTESKASCEERKKNIFDAVAVKYSSNYGNHLVAKRDFAPGEVIFEDEPYITTINNYNAHAYCGHCLKSSWACIPCDHCSWIMFCSDECRKKAWMEYHDIECDLMPRLSTKVATDLFMQGSLRALIKSIREAGSIPALKKKIDNFVICNDETAKNGFMEEKFESDKFYCLYNTTNFTLPVARSSQLTIASMMLIFLAKYTSFFGSTYAFNNGINFTSNNNVIFIGKLLLRLIKIICGHKNTVLDSNDSSSFDSLDRARMDRGTTIPLVSSLIYHGCYPNVITCYSEEMKQVIFASKPIKKDELLLLCRTMAFHQKPRGERKLFLKTYFNIDCTCIACKECWPIVIDPEYSILGRSMNYKRRYTQLQNEIVINKYKELLLSIRMDDISRITQFSNKQMISELSATILMVQENLEEPNFIMMILWIAMMRIGHIFYGCTLKIPNNCTKS